MDLVSCDFTEFVSVAFLLILFTDDVLHKAKALVFFCCLFFFFLVLFCLFGVFLVTLCSLWNLVPSLGIEPRPSAVRTQSLSHWTSREIPKVLVLLSSILSIFHFMDYAFDVKSENSSFCPRF